MADKRINMPLVPVPSWSNDDLINDPGEPWDGTATKVDPGSGKRDDGYLPEENPTAQELNQLLHELGTWIQYLSTIQVNNWQHLGSMPSANSTGEALTFDEGIASWLWGGRSDTIDGSRDSQTFATSGSTGVAAQTWHWAASKRPGDTPTHTGPNTIMGTYSNLATNVVAEFLTGGWTGFTLPAVNTARANGAVWDVQNSLWLVAGVEDTAGTPTTVFWYSVTPIVSFTKVAVTQGAVSLDIVDIAHGEDVSGGPLTVAIGDGTPFDVWTSTNGTAWSTAVPSGITAGQVAKAIMWDPARSQFVMTTADEVYTSTNGTTWTKVATISPNAFQVRFLDNDEGGLYIAADDFGEPTSIRYSVDGGASWRRVAVPPSETGSTDGPKNIAYSRYAKRFMMTFWDGAVPTSASDASVSLSVGETILEADGTISTPRVT